MSIESMLDAMGDRGDRRKALREAQEKLRSFDPGSKKLVKIAEKVLQKMEVGSKAFKPGDLVEQEEYGDYNFPIKGCPAVVLKVGKPGEFGHGKPEGQYRAEDMVIAIIDLDAELVTHSVESHKFKKVGSIYK